MFSVTPVPENKERRVSFSPDIDQSYRHHVVDKIRNLMDEVQVGQLYQIFYSKTRTGASVSNSVRRLACCT